MLDSDHSCICMCISSLRLVLSDSFATVSNSEKKKNYPQHNLVLHSIENKIYPSTWKAVFLHRINLSWNRILISIFNFEKCIFCVFHSTNEHFIAKKLGIIHLVPTQKYPFLTSLKAKDTLFLWKNLCMC